MVTGSGISLGEKIGVLVEVVIVVALAVAVAVADGQNHRVEMKSLTGQLSSMRGTVLVRTGLAGTVPLRELGTKGMLGEGAAMPEKKSLVTE
jgi:hypothetical protein